MVDTPFKLGFYLYALNFLLFIGASGQTVNVLHISKSISKVITSKFINDYWYKIRGATEDQWQDDEEISNIEEKVKFQLFNKLIPEGVFLNYSGQIKTTKFLDKSPTKFVTHGWLSAGKENVCQSIKDQYLNNENTNVLIVHWDTIAVSYLYLFVIQKLKFVADYYSNFLEEFIRLRGSDPENIHLIGHSLGAHLSGMVGKRLRANNITIGRITGLDPALPGYQEYFGLEKLSSSDAAFVDVIHTCGCTLGIMDPIGHVDFYPNGGTYPMPGCENSWSQKQCSHSRSWQYFGESITHPFSAVKCDSFDSFRNGSCSSDIIELGDNITTHARGSFYFSTSGSFPYSLGKNGTQYIPTTNKNSTLRSRNPLDELLSFQFGCGGHNVESNKNF